MLLFGIAILFGTCTRECQITRFRFLSSKSPALPPPIALPLARTPRMQMTRGMSPHECNTMQWHATASVACVKFNRDTPFPRVTFPFPLFGELILDTRTVLGRFRVNVALLQQPSITCSDFTLGRRGETLANALRSISAIHWRSRCFLCRAKADCLISLIISREEA